MDIHQGKEDYQRTGAYLLGKGGMPCNGKKVLSGDLGRNGLLLEDTAVKCRQKGFERRENGCRASQLCTFRRKAD